ncbi:MAG: ABC transporter permease subunit [Syntrophobacteraceae bacterium]|jgi:ABC-2 type transport system permease protein|nr:ABC transporter permease subunit [Syntrophobacteraceae bacterium]
MKGFAAVYRKELYSLFASPIFYVVAVVFLVITGYFLYSLVAYYNILSFQASQNPMALKQLNMSDMVVRPFFGDVSIVLLLISPLLTMRLYAEERKTGTIELLFTYPISDRSTLLAKFAAVLTAYLMILAGTLPGMLLLGYVGDPNWKGLLCGYLGTALLGGAFIALGLFTSALTQNQIVAAVLSFGALLMFWVIGWVKNLVDPGMGRFVDYISLTRHFESFTKGVLDSRDAIYYLLFMALFLFFTLRQMESHRWRG